MQAFFQESYLREHPEDEQNIEKLKDLIAWQVQTSAPTSPSAPAQGLHSPGGPAPVLPQVPLLAEGIRLHGQKVTEDLRPFHERMEQCFGQLRAKVESQYGLREMVSAAHSTRDDTTQARSDLGPQGPTRGAEAAAGQGALCMGDPGGGQHCRGGQVQGAPRSPPSLLPVLSGLLRGPAPQTPPVHGLGPRLGPAEPL